MNDTIKIQSGKTKIIAHRGLSGLERENTNAAFVAAGNRSYFGIETDIHRTADGEYVAFHDDTTERLTKENWVVEEKTLDELRSLVLKDLDDASRGDLVIPTLEEYIRICKKYVKTAILELKNPFCQKDIQEVVGRIGQEGWLEHTVFISFDLGNMITLRQLLPQQQLQFLFYELTEEIVDQLIQYRLDADIKYISVTSEVVEKLHNLGKKVNVWTVNDPKAAELLIEMGVDFITSNILEGTNRS